MKRAIVLLYCVAAYLLSVAALLYFILFLFDLVVTGSVDSRSSGDGEAGNAVMAAIIDLALVAIFGLQHSLMARPRFKALLAHLLPPAAERSTFLLGTTGALFSLCLLWQPLPWIVWHTDGLAADMLLGAGLAGWAMVLASSFLINHFDLFGLRQGWLYFLGREYTPLRFKAVALYRFIRHPILTGALIGVWATPTMTVAHLLLAIGMSVYVLIGVRFEESDLVAAFGDTYRSYMRTTGRFIPTLRGRRAVDMSLDSGQSG